MTLWQCTFDTILFRRVSACLPLNSEMPEIAQTVATIEYSPVLYSNKKTQAGNKMYKNKEKENKHKTTPFKNLTYFYYLFFFFPFFFLEKMSGLKLPSCSLHLDVCLKGK